MEASTSEEHLDLTLLEYNKLDQTANSINSKLRERSINTDKGILQHSTHTKTRLENCLIENDKSIKLLLHTGDELITNIKVANELRIIKRHESEILRDQEICQEIQENANDCNARLDIITERWTELRERSALDDSVRLTEILARQKDRINGLMSTKNEAIQTLRDNFERLNEDYELNVYKQTNDSFHIIQRMNSHLDSMRDSYKRRLDLLQHTIDNKRETLNVVANRNWQQLADKVESNMRMKVDLEQNKRDFFANEIARIKFDHIETTGRARINLESYQEQMQIDLQQLRATCLMNSEKFDYNYQILQKKGDENVNVRQQEKRRLAQLRESAVALRTQISDARSSLQRTADKMDKDIVRFHGSFMELECRADMYASNNDKKFRQIWNTNKSLATSLLDKVLAIDKVLFEQQLCFAWPIPDLKISYENELSSFRSHTDFTDGAQQSTSARQSKADFHREMLADTRVIRMILRNVAEESGFIVDEKLHQLLVPYMQEQRTIIEIDQIFSALGIKDILDHSTLNKYFLPYAWCTNCTLRDVRKSEDSPKINANATNNTIDDAFIVSQISRKSNNKTGIEVDEENPTKCIRHNIVMESNKVLLAVREFLSDCRNKDKLDRTNDTDTTTMVARLSRQRNTQSRMLTTTDIVEYWKRFECIFNGSRLWASIEAGLKIYLHALQRRDQLDTECEYLRKQNSDLRHMLSLK